MNILRYQDISSLSTQLLTHMSDHVEVPSLRGPSPNPTWPLPELNLPISDVPMNLRDGWGGGTLDLKNGLETLIMCSL